MSTTTKNAPKEVDNVEVPEDTSNVIRIGGVAITNEGGKLLKLNRGSFPKGIDGSEAYCDYQIIKLTQKKQRVRTRKDPRAQELARLIARRDRTKAKLEELDETIKALKEEKENDTET